MTELSDKTKDDFQPHIEVSHRSPYSSHNGIIYYGFGQVDEKVVFFRWTDEVITSIGSWRRYNLGDISPDYTDHVEISRERFGFRVYTCYSLTPKQQNLYDLRKEIEGRFPHVPRNDQGPIDQDAWHKRYKEVEQAKENAGCTFDDLRNATKDSPPENFLGYFFLDGIEQPEEYAWYASLEKLSEASQEIQDLVNNTPVAYD